MLLFVFFILEAQEENTGDATGGRKHFAVTVGYLHAGGSYIGADFEYLFSKKIGLQAGIGYYGYETGLNFHYKPSVRSSFISLKYWHQGIGEKFRQDAVGATFNFRARRLIATQLGLGFPMKTGPAMADDYVVPDVMLLYSIGIYLPF